LADFNTVFDNLAVAYFLGHPVVRAARPAKLVCALLLPAVINSILRKTSVKTAVSDCDLFFRTAKKLHFYYFCGFIWFMYF